MNYTNYNQLVQLLKPIEGFRGLGFGLKEINNHPTKTHSWRVYINNKLPFSQIHFKERIPRYYKGYPTDVIEVCQTVIATTRESSFHYSGSSIANSKGIPGSLGCIAWSKNENRVVFLTNYHVLFSGGAKENDTVWLITKTEESIRAEKLGVTLEGRHCLVNYNNSPHFIDCAIGTFDQFSNASNDNSGRSAKKEIRYAKVGMKVFKNGAGSGYTSGVVVDACYPDTYNVDDNCFNAPNQILIKSMSEATGSYSCFSREGDSGSVVYDSDGTTIGLLWGTNTRGDGIANHIAPITRELNIEIL